MISKRLYVTFPIAILVLEWILVFYLHFNNPYHFITISKGTFSIIMLGLICLLMGYLTAHSFYLNGKNDMPDVSQKIYVDQRALGIFVLIISGIVLLGLLISVQEIAKATNGFKLYFTNPFQARVRIVMLQEGSIQNISKLNFKFGSYLTSLMFPLSILGGIAIAQKSRWRFTGLFPLILVIIYSLLYLNRFGLITSLGLWFFTLIYYSIYLPENERKTLLKKIALYAVLAIVFVSLFFYLILSIRAFYISDIGYYIKRSFYAYFAGSPAAFEKLLNEPQPLMYGASSFRSVVKWFGRLGLVETGQYLGAHNAFKNISLGSPMTMNTFTFVKTLYEDFGILGVAFITTIWGALARYFIEKGFQKFSLLNLFIIAVFVLSFLMTFYEFFFQGITMFI